MNPRPLRRRATTAPRSPRRLRSALGAGALAAGLLAGPAALAQTYYYVPQSPVYAAPQVQGVAPYIYAPQVPRYYAPWAQAPTSRYAPQAPTYGGYYRPPGYYYVPQAPGVAPPQGYYPAPFSTYSSGYGGYGGYPGYGAYGGAPSRVLIPPAMGQGGTAVGSDLAPPAPAATVPSVPSLGGPSEPPPGVGIIGGPVR